MTGTEMKALIHNAGVKCWQVAEALGMHDSNFSRRLRKPFSKEETAKINAIIEDLVEMQEICTKVESYCTVDEDDNVSKKRNAHRLEPSEH
ncbi:MAG: hypothetical protein K2J71_00595 [Oscillospiraceae bacterium]|nr:hypothetical protein [Oscillospiraceae bacterium]